MPPTPTRSRFIRATAFVCALSISLLSCDRGGAFAPVSIDGTFISATSGAVFVRAEPRGGRNDETWFVSGTVEFRPDLTGRIITRFETRSTTDTIRKEVAAPFTYRLSDERIIVDANYCGFGLCAAILAYEYFDFGDPGLVRWVGATPVPYRRIE